MAFIVNPRLLLICHYSQWSLASMVGLHTSTIALITRVVKRPPPLAEDWREYRKDPLKWTKDKQLANKSWSERFHEADKSRSLVQKMAENTRANMEAEKRSRNATPRSSKPKKRSKRSTDRTTGGDGIEEERLLSQVSDFDEELEEKRPRRVLPLTDYQKAIKKATRQPRENNMLTYAAKRQILYLIDKDPGFWTTAKIAEHFPVSIDGAKRLIRNSEFKIDDPCHIEKHDEMVKKRWKALLTGDNSDQLLSDYTLRLFSEGKIALIPLQGGQENEPIEAESSNFELQLVEEAPASSHLALLKNYVTALNNRKLDAKSKTS